MNTAKEISFYKHTTRTLAWVGVFGLLGCSAATTHEEIHGPAGGKADSFASADVTHAVACFDGMVECGLSELSRYNGAVGDVRAKDAIERCLTKADVAARPCKGVCSGAGRQLCSDTQSVLIYLVDQPTACETSLRSCVDDCIDVWTDANDGFAPDNSSETALGACIGTADEQCLPLTARLIGCGGSFEKDTAAYDFAYCMATHSPGASLAVDVYGLCVDESGYDPLAPGTFACPFEQHDSWYVVQAGGDEFRTVSGHSLRRLDSLSDLDKSRVIAMVKTQKISVRTITQAREQILLDTVDTYEITDEATNNIWHAYTFTLANTAYDPIVGAIFPEDSAGPIASITEDFLSCLP